MTEVATKLGHLVVIEGNEGTGKSTLREALHKRLVDAGHDVVLVREPGGTPRAEHYRELVKKPREYPMSHVEEFFLFAAAREDLYRTVIGPALAEGKVVLADRGYFSSYALQIHPYATDNGQLMQLFNIITANNWSNLGNTPAIQIALTLDEEVRQARLAGRGTTDAMEDKPAEVLAKINEAYGILAQQPGVLVFDGAMDIDELADAAFNQVVICFEQRVTEVAIAAERAAEAAKLKAGEEPVEDGMDAEPEAPKEVTIADLEVLMLGELDMHAGKIAEMYGDIAKLEVEWNQQLETLRAWIKRHMTELSARTEPLYEMEAHQRTAQISGNIGQMLAAWLALANIKLLNEAALAPVKDDEEQGVELGAAVPAE